VKHILCFSRVRKERRPDWLNDVAYGVFGDGLRLPVLDWQRKEAVAVT
jgi:hypothetical protein